MKGKKALPSSWAALGISLCGKARGQKEEKHVFKATLYEGNIKNVLPNLLSIIIEKYETFYQLL